MDGLTLGVFGSDAGLKEAFEASVGKKSEAEGITVFHRVESGKKISLLDDATYPERIQGYSRIASISDHALYLFPKSRGLSAPDGELAVLVQSFGLQGRVEVFDEAVSLDAARSSFKGTSLESFRYEARTSGSSVLGVEGISPRADFGKGTLVYIDRSFTVKGVGTVALGFVLSGSLKVHDDLRLLPAQGEPKSAEVRGIQINDEDFDSCGRGIRVGLSLKGVEPKDLEKTYWLDDGSLGTTAKLGFAFSPSPFYKQAVKGRDMHLQLPGQTAVASITEAGGRFVADLQFETPVWEGMRVAVLDLNGKGLRVAGGGTCNI
ncbi:MAG TPA: EF-Tu/IF-2/RF-3 family GTPase [Nitrososphaerales archaeon]|nr:EF-Tu/IF-2/RF-3 family GTPase [Nitrososphaerales archaeon]